MNATTATPLSYRDRAVLRAIAAGRLRDLRDVRWKSGHRRRVVHRPVRGPAAHRGRSDHRRSARRSRSTHCVRPGAARGSVTK